jgi:hypothetical protein
VNGRELAQILIQSETFEWSFNLRPKGSPLAVGLMREPRDPFLKQGIAVTSAALTALLLLGLFWPAAAPLPPNTIEPITIVLEKPLLQKKVAAMPAGTSSSKKATKVARMDIAPVHQGDKLQSAMRGLFRGGMTKLLEKSEFAGSADGNESVRKLFNARSNGLHSTAPVTGPGIGKGVQISALGGGEAHGAGKGVGYGHGDHANITGQGNPWSGWIPPALRSKKA